MLWACCQKPEVLVNIRHHRPPSKDVVDHRRSRCSRHVGCTGIRRRRTSTQPPMTSTSTELLGKTSTGCRCCMTLLYRQRTADTDRYGCGGGTASLQPAAVSLFRRPITILLFDSHAQTIAQPVKLLRVCVRFLRDAHQSVTAAMQTILRSSSALKQR
jgi:hypothetical protein